MSTTLPPGSRTAGFSTIFWKIHGCEERRLIFRRTRGRVLGRTGAGEEEWGASDGVVMIFSSRTGAKHSLHYTEAVAPPGQGRKNSAAGRFRPGSAPNWVSLDVATCDRMKEIMKP